MRDKLIVVARTAGRPAAAPGRLARRMLAVAILVFGFMLLQGTALAGAATTPVLSGSVANKTSLSGAGYVAVSGHYAYTLAYLAGTVTVVDISNPAAPAVVGQSAYAPSLQNAAHIVISGHYAYVVSQNRNGISGSGVNDDGTGNALTILDISNPTAPTIVGSVHDSRLLFGAHGVAVSGSYAFVAAQGCLSGQPCPDSTVGNALVVIDVSNPASPQIVASISNASLPPQWSGTSALLHACGIAVSGNYAYVTASYSARLTVIDISNPLQPAIVASIQNKSVGSTLPLPVDVAVANGYAYVANEVNNGILTVVDVHNPLSPHVVGSITSAADLAGAYRVRVRGNFAYVASSYAQAMAAVDISDPANPRVAGVFTSSGLLNKTVGIDVDPSNQYAISTSPWLSTQTRTLYPPFTFLTGTVNVIQLDPAPINVTISSSPPSTTGATTASFAFQPSDDISTMRCQLDGSTFGLCTTPTTQSYSGLATGIHMFTAEAIDAAGNTATATYTWTILPQSSQPPANTQPPLIAGTVAVGQQLQASAGTWTGTPAPVFSYQWQRCNSSGNNCNPIQGATNSTYTISSGDAGSTLDVAVTGTNTAGSAQAVSAATTVVPQPSPPPRQHATAADHGHDRGRPTAAGERRHLDRHPRTGLQLPVAALQQQRQQLQPDPGRHQHHLHHRQPPTPARPSTSPSPPPTLPAAPKPSPPPPASYRAPRGCRRPLRRRHRCWITSTAPTGPWARTGRSSTQARSRP